MPNLSYNEKEMLKLLLDNGRITDKEISEKLNISSQACGKIRKKMDQSGIITGYTCCLDFEKIGLEAFAIIFVRLSTKFFNELKDIDIFKKVGKNIRFIFCCAPSDPDISLICLTAFRNISEMDEYMKKLKANLSDYFESLHVVPFSIGNLLKFNPNYLLKQHIDGGKIEPISSLDEFRRL
ncbi:MAG: Lrp/AsnC family transcriptional regulator [Thermoplasmatales archaeon]|nr:MAG: Lrp/AsnC family transcriptional regulator [Thermoplasmatales archaeon]